MSIRTNSVEEIKVVGAWDPRINAKASKEQIYVAVKNPSVNTIQSYNSTGLSNDNVTFNVIPPSNKIFLDRLLMYKEIFTATIPGDVRNNLGVNLGLRQWPLNSSFQTVNCNIDTQTLTGVTAQVVHALTRYSTCYRRQDRVNSLTASEPDQYQSYNDWQSPLFGGSLRNSNSAYGESPFQTRGALLPDSTVYDGVNTILTYTLQEPLFLLPPFLSDEEEHLGLINVKNIQFNINYVSALGARRFSWDGLGVAVASIAVNIVSANMIANWLTPPLTEYVPDLITYPYYNYIQYTSNNVTLGAGSSTQTTTNLVELREIPKRIYIFVKKADSVLYTSTGFTLTDTFATIQQLSVTFNNLTNMFSTYGPRDLYNMCRRNGLEMNYAQFSNFCGSVICIEPKDMGMPATLSAGVVGNYNLQATINYTNPSGASTTYTPYIVVVYEGVMSVGTGGTTLQTGVLSSSALVNSPDLPQSDYYMLQTPGMGGSIFGRLKSFLMGAKPYINKIARVAESVGEQLGSVHPAFQTVGRIGSVARQLTGGRRMSRKALKKRRGRGLYGAGLEENEDLPLDV